MPEQRTKKYVEVIADFSPEGILTPQTVIWDTGQRFDITCISEVLPRKYEPWQIEYYVESATPWPECCRLFKKHAAYCAKHGDVGFDEWLEEINNDPAQNDEDDDFDYSMYDKYNPPKVNYSCGEAMDRELDFNGDPVPVDC